MDTPETAWAGCGAMFLTGRSDGPPLGGPAALLDTIATAQDILSRHRDGSDAVDGLALLGERAACATLSRQGATSCGGSTRLVQAKDGWLALALARPEDVASLSAWLQLDVPAADPWPTITEAASVRPAEELDERAALLGLPMAALGSVDGVTNRAFGLPVEASLVRETNAATVPIRQARVVDLSALWAGPLCAQLLSSAGAQVIKVESTGRPDGARRGPDRFFDLLNGTKRSVALDLASELGRKDLRRLIESADVVVESARPRALEQLGIVALDVLGQVRGPSVWVSITSHGRAPGRAERVGFGDVAAVAGGLVATDAHGPCFLADAVTDPVSGLVGAAAALEGLAHGGRWLLSVAMAPMAASMKGPPMDVSRQLALPPRARPVVSPAPLLGADTSAVLGTLTP